MIDGADSTKDNGYLQLARKYNPEAYKVDEATDVRPALARRKRFNAIIGHGSPGSISAGSGTAFTTADQSIELYNVSSIGFDKLGNSSALWIYACQTGADFEGASLLFEIAKQTQCPVYAPNGLIFLNDNGEFSLQENAGWQVAVPGKGLPPTMPKALPPTEPPSLPSGGIESLSGRPWPRVSQLTYDLKERRAVERLATERSKSISSRGDAQWVVTKLGLAMPYRIKGVPGSQHTGNLLFEFEDGSREPTKGSFRVFNDCLIEDSETGLFYFTSEPVSSVINGWKPTSN